MCFAGLRGVLVLRVHIHLLSLQYSGHSGVV